MKDNISSSPILNIVSRILFAPIIIFGLYVQFHGEYGPGGGFQAGVIFAAGFVLESATVSPVSSLSSCSTEGGAGFKLLSDSFALDEQPKSNRTDDTQNTCVRY